MKAGQVIRNKRRPHVRRRILSVNKDGTLFTQRIDGEGRQTYRFALIGRVYEWRLVSDTP